MLAIIVDWQGNSDKVKQDKNYASFISFKLYMYNYYLYICIYFYSSIIS